jgi:hypothetical protein
MTVATQLMNWIVLIARPAILVSTRRTSGPAKCTFQAMLTD